MNTMTKEQKKDLVKRRLWQCGYSVRDMARVFGEGMEPFDLLVEGVYPVVVEDTEKLHENKITAVVSKSRGIYYAYEVGNKTFTEQSHSKVFSQKKNGSN